MQEEAFDIFLSFWGKTEIDSSQWHPLICHMLDVANVTKHMLNSSINNTRTNFLSRYYKQETDESVNKISFLAGLHDLGKGSPPFQGLWKDYCKSLMNKGLKFPPINDTTKKHGLMTSSFIMNSLNQDKKEETDKTLKIIFEKLAISLGGHHGVMTDKMKWQNYANNKFYAGSATWFDARDRLIKEYYKLVFGVDACDIELKQMVIDALPKKDMFKELKTDDSFFMLLSGLTSIADWLGSSTEWFKFDTINSSKDLLEYQARSLESAKNAVECIWPQNKGLEKEFVDGNELFKHLFTSIDSPRPMQDKCIKIFPYTTDKIKTKQGIVIIEAPTGEGKTEASFYLMDNWLRKDVAKGAYIALPTQATSNQMFKRFAEYMATGHGLNITINLSHSMKDYNTTWVEINNKSLSDGKYDALVANSWFEKSKRRLITPFGVGTIDQTLMGVLQVKHMFVRLFGLSGKTVIFDEVHAYDIYMSTLLERLIQWLSALGSSVILLSATLPAHQKKKLLKAYIGDDKYTDLKPIYPAITYSDSLSKPQVTEFESNPNVRQNVTIVPVENDIAIVSKILQEKISQGGCAAWICNTVKKSQEVFTFLLNQPKDDMDLMLFHAKFMASDRLAIENLLIDKMGKPEVSNRPKKAIIVATQVIEQSLDLDFDVMVSDLSPIDLLIQRVGRLHRHNRSSRPKGCSEPEILLMMPGMVDDIPDFGSSKYVYDEHILLRTYLVLKSKFENNSYKFCDRDKTVKELVEMVYGNDNLKASQKVHAHLKKLKNEFDKEKEEIESIANERIIDAPLSEKTSDANDSHFKFSFINNIEVEDDDPDASQKFKALTRLSDEPSIKVACVFETNGTQFLNTDSTIPIDLSRVPMVSEIESILMNTITISDKTAYFKLIGKNLVPKVWFDVPPLRYLPLLVFKCVNGQWQINIDNLRMSYSNQIGFQVLKDGKA